jgi:type III restriction enzyme
MEVSKVGRALLLGRGERPITVETEGAMLERACGELLTLKNIVVIWPAAGPVDRRLS